MIEQGFTEFQTPILTATSPEGARDFLVPSRLHPGKFYALPQAPQQFKQLLMVAGLRPLFPDRALLPRRGRRADRSPGEFYQLDFEMSFVTQEDVFAAIEPVLHGVFEEFAGGREVTPPPFPRIPYDDAMLQYGTRQARPAQPARDHRRHRALPRLGLRPVREHGRATGGVVRAIPAPGAAAKPRSFFDKMNEWARSEGPAGLGYIVFATATAPRGRSRETSDAARLAAIRARGLASSDGDAVFFVCGKPRRRPRSSPASCAHAARARSSA